MRIAWAIAFFGLLPVAAAADLAAEMRKCSIEKSHVSRLACFDKLIPQTEIKEAAKPLGHTGKWRVSTETSRIDDSRNAFVMLEADEPIRGWPSKIHTPDIVIRCKEKKTEVYIVTGMAPNVEYGNHDGATVTFRLDKQPPFKVNANKSTNGEALFLPQATSLLKRLMNGDTLLFQFIPFNSSNQMTTFDIRGMAEAIKPVRDACKW